MSISSGLVEKSVSEKYDKKVKEQKQSKVEERVVPKITLKKFAVETETGYSPTDKPGMMSSPTLTEKTTATDLPAFLEAFRLLRNG